jgi:hypothetical protein
VIAIILSLLFVGIVLGFFVPPFGFIPAAVALVLFVLYLFGWMRGTTTTDAR